MSKKRKKLNMGNTGPLVDVIRREIGQPLRGVEVGVHRGETSALLLRAFPALHLYLVDPWTTYPESHLYRQSGDGCSKLTQAEQDANLRATVENVQFARNRCTIIRATSVEVGEQFKFCAVHGKPLDFAFIDDDHTYEGVRNSILAWWHNLTPGGLLAGHDFGHPRDRRGIWGVSRASLEWATQVEQKLCTSGELWWITKPEEAEEAGDGPSYGRYQAGVFYSRLKNVFL